MSSGPHALPGLIKEEISIISLLVIGLKKKDAGLS